MIYTLLILTVGAAPQSTLRAPQSTLRAPQSTLSDLPAVKETPRVTPAYVSPIGYHRHMDSKGNVWEHSDNENKYTNPHLSPVTGELILEKYKGPKAPTHESLPRYPPRQSMAVLDCPPRKA